MTPYDKWLTHDTTHLDDEFEELDYKCPKCGHTSDEHPEVPTPDGNNVMQVCPTDEEDHRSQGYVLGAVLAQLEDLSVEEQSQVLHLALAAVETAEEVANEMPLTPEERCPRCNSDLITFIDEHYSECCDCGWSGSAGPA